MLKKLESFYYFIVIFSIILSFILTPLAFLYNYHKVSLKKEHIEGINKGYAYRVSLAEVSENLLIESSEDSLVEIIKYSVNDIPHKERNIKLIGKHYEKLKDKIVE